MNGWAMLRAVGIGPRGDEPFDRHTESTTPDYGLAGAEAEDYDKREVRLERDIHFLVVELQALRRARTYRANRARRRGTGDVDRDRLS